MQKQTKPSKTLGFTLIEMLLSISLMAILAGLSVPLYQSFQVKNDLDIAAVSLAQSMRRAQILTQSVEGDTSWGVNVQSGMITLYKGTTYAKRETEYDELTAMPTSITPSGLTEIVFTKFSGLPQVTGATTLTTSTNESRAIHINEKGMVSY